MEFLMTGRRRFVVGGAAFAGAALASPYVALGQGALQPAKISVGRIPWAAMNAPITQYMIENKLFEKRAAELGYQLTVDWRDYPTALPMVEAIVGNNLDMGMWGNTPIIRAISAKLPISLVCVGEGHQRIVIATRKGSPIRTIDDLKGKTVGTLLGGDPYNALTQMLRWNLGSANPKDNGIRLVNIPTLAQAAQVPNGLDATSAFYPAFLAAQANGTSTAVANSYGYTEDYYDGPLGKGPGILIPTVKQSPFFPDGYYLHRSFWLLNNAVAEKTPKVALAFLLAQQDALTALNDMHNAGAVSQLVKSFWQLDAPEGAKVVDEDVLTIRGWSWPTENDARAVLEVSKYLVESKAIEKPLAWAQVKGAFERTAPVVKEAYDRLGLKPDPSEFTRTDTPDLRGKPVWQMDQWTERS